MDEACTGTLVSGFEKTYAFDIPETGSTPHVFPAASTAYVDPPPSSSDFLPAGVTCSQTFSYEMTYFDAATSPTGVGHAKPAGLTMDPSNGRFTFVNSADVLADYTVNIVIETSDGQNVDTRKVTGVHITSACGAASTSITTNAADSVFASEDYQSSQVAQTFSITSSNSLCPVSTVSVSDLNNAFSVAYTAGASSYVLSLATDQSRTMGTYPYSLTATASGDSTMTVDNDVEITYTCVSAQLNDGSLHPTDDFTLSASIPASGTTQVTVISNIYQYVTAAHVDSYNVGDDACWQSFSIATPVINSAPLSSTSDDGGVWDSVTDFFSDGWDRITGNDDEPASDRIIVSDVITNGFSIDESTGEVSLTLSSTGIGTY